MDSRNDNPLSDVEARSGEAEGVRVQDSPEGVEYPYAAVLAFKQDAEVIAELRRRLDAIHTLTIGVTVDPRLSATSREIVLRIGDLSDIPCPKSELPAPDAMEPGNSPSVVPSEAPTADDANGAAAPVEYAYRRALERIRNLCKTYPSAADAANWAIDIASAACEEAGPSHHHCNADFCNVCGRGMSRPPECAEIDFENGRIRRREGGRLIDNPYPRESEGAQNWERGWKVEHYAILKAARSGEAPACECAARHLAQKFRESHYARADHSYSGIEILQWLEAQGAEPCLCEGLREQLADTERMRDKYAGALQSATAAAKRRGAERDSLRAKLEKSLGVESQLRDFVRMYTDEGVRQRQEIDSLRADLTASQERERKMREALDLIEKAATVPVPGSAFRKMCGYCTAPSAPSDKEISHESDCPVTVVRAARALTPEGTDER